MIDEWLPPAQAGTNDVQNVTPYQVRIFNMLFCCEPECEPRTAN
jgi:hypothetical protein